MDIDEEFDSLGLSKEKKSLAWEARAKITWGDRSDEVKSWLTDKGIDPLTANQIVAIAVRERAKATRVKGIQDLLLGLLIGVSGAGVGIGAVLFVKLGLFAVPVKGLGVLIAFSFLASMFGFHRICRGLHRIMAGARIKGAVSDVEDWL